MKKILFVGVHNSGRSQMAEAWMNNLCGERFLAQSAGITPAASVNPLVTKAMQEYGIDISGQKPRSVFDVYRSGETFSYIITVCDMESAERCPVFLGLIRQLHWSFPDPSALSGSDEEKLSTIRTIRDSMRERILSWCREDSEEEEFL
jgi:arsenate reductase (thioredoxin)